MTISVEIRAIMDSSTRQVFTRSDFTGMASYSQIGRVLKAMVIGGELLNIGYGLYTKARINRITGRSKSINMLLATLTAKNTLCSGKKHGYFAPVGAGEKTLVIRS